jgi:Na+-transporting methylmalonyl-CoA/oxaloacetate decarboxylase gamma subunit
MKKIALGLLLAVLVFSPLLSFAQGTPNCIPGFGCNPNGTGSGGGSGAGDVVLVHNWKEACQLIHRLINVVFSILMLLAVVFILLSAFNYLTANGSTEKVENATKHLTNAIIAVVIAVLAWSIPMVVTSFLFDASPNASQSSVSFFSCPS